MLNKGYPKQTRIPRADWIPCQCHLMAVTREASAVEKALAGIFRPDADEDDQSNQNFDTW